MKITAKVFLGPRPISSASVAGLCVRIFLFFNWVVETRLINFHNTRVGSITSQRINLQQQHNVKSCGWRDWRWTCERDYDENTWNLIKSFGNFSPLARVLSMLSAPTKRRRKENSREKSMAINLMEARTPLFADHSLPNKKTENHRFRVAINRQKKISIRPEMEGKRGERGKRQSGKNYHERRDETKSRENFARFDENF